jgi:hypothetical protein
MMNVVVLMTTVLLFRMESNIAVLTAQRIQNVEVAVYVLTLVEDLSSVFLVISIV